MLFNVAKMVGPRGKSQDIGRMVMDPYHPALVGVNISDGRHYCPTFEKERDHTRVLVGLLLFVRPGYIFQAQLPTRWEAGLSGEVG